MPRPLLLALAALGLLTGGASADFEIDQATFPPHAATRPELAVSLDHYTALAYVTQLDGTGDPQVAVRLVPTNPQTDEVWPEPVVFGPGTLPAICWSRDGFTLAYAHGQTLRLYQSDLGGVWDLDDPVVLDLDGDVTGLDLWGAPTDAAGHAVFLSFDVDTDPSYPRVCNVHFASRSSYDGWSEVQTLAGPLDERPQSQVSWGTGPAGPWPVVYYLDGYQLWRVAWVEDAWTAPFLIPGDGGGPSIFEGPFDVARSAEVGILGLGPQPVCPCGTIHFKLRDANGQWQPQEDLTVHHEYFDWPFSPSLAAGWDGVMHAFWRQLGSAPDMSAHATYLEYWTRENGVWTDRGDILDPLWMEGIEWHVDAGVSPDGAWKVLAWSEADTVLGEPMPEQVYVARSYPVLAAPDEATPRAPVELSAWPNPFNPRVNLAVTLLRGGAARLAIYDARGRCLRTVHAGPLGSGRHEFAWDGRSNGGARAPSGVYFARLSCGDGETVRKLVLAE